MPAPHGLLLQQVGISSVWYEGNPCNMHLMDLAEAVKKGVEEVGLVGYRFNTIGVSGKGPIPFLPPPPVCLCPAPMPCYPPSDGISMGTNGMSFSLQSRDIIADSIETVMSAQWYDANISLPGCDKNMPGCLIAMGRLNRPSLMVYGGTIKPGHSSLTGEPLDIVSAFQSYGAFAAGIMSEEQRYDTVSHGPRMVARRVPCLHTRSSSCRPFWPPQLVLAAR